EVEGTVSGMLREVRDVEGRGVLVREAQHGGEPVLRARERERGHGWKCPAPPGQPRRARRGPGLARRGTGRTSGTAPTCAAVGPTRGEPAGAGPARAPCARRT